MVSKVKVLIFCPRLLETGGIESHIKSFISQLYLHLDIYLLVLDSRLSKMQFDNYSSMCKKVWEIKESGNISRIPFFIFKIFQIRSYEFNFIYTNGQGDSISLLRKIIGKKPYWIHHHHTDVSIAISNTWSNEYFDCLKQSDYLISCSNKTSVKLKDILQRDCNFLPCFSTKVKSGEIKILKYPIKIGYYGRLIPEKGITRLCRLSKIIDPKIVEFHIWGKGSLYNETFFNNYSNLKYHGSFEGAMELEKVIDYMDIYILLTEHPEGLPISLLEFMSAGKPWIATSVGGIEDIVVDANWNFIVSNDQSDEELANEIVEISKKLIGKENIFDVQVSHYSQYFTAEFIKEQWLKLVG